MVLLKSYSSLNFAGLIKILKKYDKRTGAMLSMPFTQLAFHQPFFITEPLTRLIHECEAKLESLFPLGAEVVEPSTAVAVDHAGTNASLETTLLLVEETVDIYRSTLSAINTIEGLRKPSSTYNDLSMSYLFGRRNDESAGDVTAENSPCNSFVEEEDEKEEEEDIRFLNEISNLFFVLVYTQLILPEIDGVHICQLSSQKLCEYIVMQ
ncbi:SPX domain-containing protein 4 [Salvia divinorum]|uniref:SPX domain-containing protein 4 n=1 Tax=Salvia divinorum TaxID=28513 RepID=A0ABD1HPM7_SALDI